MKEKPEYFNEVWQRSHERWTQLERDEELASPWWQLFNQILSPRHVISELLQNADDAGAVQVVVNLEDGVFTLQHDGRDFSKDDFSSLCRFGYSNKRKMHTIGFRGIGFKSTFSLGSRVEVFSPTLQVAFDKKRFTQPIWLETDQDFGPWTTIRVRLEEPQINEVLQQSIESWVENPLPLLFFQNIKQLTLLGRTITRQVLGHGPVAGSTWVRLSDSENEQELLLIRSPLLEVDEAIQQEVRQERNDPSFQVQPLEIHLVLGLKSQRLYQVLPTGVTLDLPFSINAPFIQDPARTGIKAPSVSALNRFLLMQAAQLAYESFQNWLANSSLSLKERAQAYQLLPDANLPTTATIVGDCHRYVLSAFREGLHGAPCLLTSQGKLARAGECLGLDAALLEIWQEDELCAIFGKGHAHVLTKEVDGYDRRLLQAWGLLENLSFKGVFEALCRQTRLAHPGMEKLKRLWGYIGAGFGSLGFLERLGVENRLHIVPASGCEFLQPPARVMLPSRKDKQLTAAEFGFVQRYIFILDAEWLAYLQGLAKRLKELQEEEQFIWGLFEGLGVLSGTSIEKLMAEAVHNIFSHEDPGEDGIKVAHILARLDIPAPGGLKYRCRDGRWRRADGELVLVDDPSLAGLLPQEMLLSNVVSDAYEDGLSAAELKIWRQWAYSPHSRLKRFVLPESKNLGLEGREQLTRFLESRNAQLITAPPIKSKKFNAHDYDFSERLWRFWEEKSCSDETIWLEMVKLIAQDWGEEWQRHTEISISVEGYKWNHDLNVRNLKAGWLMKLRQKACVPDTYQKPRFPAELLLRNSQTAMLEKIEPFVHPNWDQPDFHPFIKLLGVRERASDPQKILDRLRALSRLEQPLIAETGNLYQVLERMFSYMPEQTAQSVIGVFQNEPLILGEDGGWYRSREIYQNNPQQIPGLAVLHPAIQGLNLWDRLQIARHPGLKDALDWLASLRSGVSLQAAELNRVQAILAKYPHESLSYTRHWLNVRAQWQPLGQLSYTLEHPQQAAELFNWVREQTADFSMLFHRFSLAGLADEYRLTPLETALKYIVSQTRYLYRPTPEWIPALGRQLLRVRGIRSQSTHSLDAPALDLANLRQHAQRLTEIRLSLVQNLQATPYLNGQPAGYPVARKALWDGCFLYVEHDEDWPFLEIKDALTQPFRDASIRAAISDCMDRPPEWIERYFSNYFIFAESEDNPATDDPLQPEVESTAKMGSSVNLASAANVHHAAETSDRAEEAVSLPDENETEDQNAAEPAVSANKPGRRKPLRPEERFAHFIGAEHYLWQADRKRFVNPSGNRIVLEDGLFPWVEYDRHGQVLRRFRLVEGSLEQGLQLPAEVWNLLHADAVGLLELVVQENDQYFRYNSLSLNRLIRENKIIIQPKTYWIRQTS